MTQTVSFAFDEALLDSAECGKSSRCFVSRTTDVVVTNEKGNIIDEFRIFLNLFCNSSSTSKIKFRKKYIFDQRQLGVWRGRQMHLI